MGKLLYNYPYGFRADFPRVTVYSVSSNTLRDAHIWSILPHIALAASEFSCFRHENASRYSGNSQDPCTFRQRNCHLNSPDIDLYTGIYAKKQAVHPAMTGVCRPFSLSALFDRSPSGSAIYKFMYVSVRCKGVQPQNLFPDPFRCFLAADCGRRLQNFTVPKVLCFAKGCGVPAVVFSLRTDFMPSPANGEEKIHLQLH